MRRRLLAIVLCICMVLALVPTALAAETMTAYHITDATASRMYYNNELTTGERVNANISDIPDDGAAVFIFFSAQCSNCRYLFQQLNMCNWLASDKLVITAVESNRNDQTTVQNFVDSYAPDAAQYMNIYYNENGNGFLQAYWAQLPDIEGITWPLVVVVTEEDGVRTIRFADIVMTSPARLYNSIASIRPGFADTLVEEYAVEVTVLGAEYASKAAAAVNELNAHRAESGLTSLTRSVVLSELAMERAAETALFYSSEFRPSGQPAATIFDGAYTAANTAQLVNAGAANAGAVVAGWLESDQTQLLSADYTQVGIGCYETNDTFFWALLLGNGTDTATDNTADVAVQTPIRIMKDRILLQNTGGSSLNLDTSDNAQLRLYNWNRGNTNYYAQLLPVNPSATDSTGRELAQLTVQEDGSVLLTPTAVGEGVVYLPAYAGQTDYTIPLTVTEAPPAYPITLSYNNGGILYTSADEVEAGETFFVYLHIYDGFSLESVTFSPEAEYTAASDTTYRVVMPDGPLQITAKFVRDIPYAVTLIYDADHGTVTLDPASPEPGDAVTVTAVPNDGWHVETIDGWRSSYYSEFSGLTEIGANRWQFTMPEDDVTVEVTFAETNPLYALNVICDEGGTAQLSHTAAHAGETIQLTVLPDEGWQLSSRSISVDGSYAPDLEEVEDNVYQFTMPAGNITIRLSFVEMGSEHYHYYIGKVTKPSCTVGGYTTYTCSCGDSYVDNYTDPLGHDWQNGTCTRCGAAQESSFTDVPRDAYFYEPVIWAVEQGITNGYGSADTFAPDVVCNRGQVVTFLWRAAGQPEPSNNVNPFTDIKESDYFYKAVLWAVEEGITAGYGSDTIFNPNGSCTRGQVATFLWRYFGQPQPESVENPFNDVSSNEFYYTAVLWAAESGITAGYGNAYTFAPNMACNRGQVVTFLYRAMN